METTLRAKRWVVRRRPAPPESLRRRGRDQLLLDRRPGRPRRDRPRPVFNDGYAAASRAVSLLTETWAREAAPEVRVNEIMLGFVDTRHGPEPAAGAF